MFKFKQREQKLCPYCNCERIKWNHKFYVCVWCVECNRKWRVWHTERGPKKK